jgi:two-component system cell cycle sensor histidine kinase/response regulator CckA
VGYKREELIGKNIALIAHEENKDKIEENILRLLAGEKLQQIVRSPRKDRSNCFLQLIESSIRLPSGETGIISVSQDITEKVITENALRDSEEKLRQIVEHSTNLFYSHTPDHVLTYVSPQSQHFFDLDPDEALIRWTELVTDHPLNAIGFERTEQAIKTGEVQPSYELQLVTPKGRLLWVEVNEAPVVENGKAVAIVGALTDITERKEAEDKLKHAHTNLQRQLLFIEALMDSIPNPLFYKDKDGRYLGCNKAFSEIMSIDSVDINGKTVFDLWPKKLASFYHKKDMELMKRPTYQVYEAKIKNRDGELKDVIFNNGVYFDEENNPAGIVGVYSDITELKKTANALEESENRLALAVESANLGLWDQNFKTGEVIRNARWAEMLGFSEDEITNELNGWYDLIHEDDIEQMKEIVRKHTVGESERFIVEHRLRTKDNKWKWILNSGRVVERDKKGTPVRALGVHMDINERKIAEDALRESEEKYRTLIEQSGDAIFLQYNRKFELVNKKFLELFGIEAKTLHAPDFDFLQLVAPKSKKELEERFMKISTGEQPKQKFEFIAQTAAGQELEIEASVSYIPYKDGYATQGILRDITERRKLEEQLRQAQKMEAIGRLAGGVAHDFNNLLTVISGYSELLLSKNSTDMSFVESIKQIRSASERAAALTSQLLAFSRKQIVKPELLDVNRFITDSTKMFIRLIGEDISIRLELQENLPAILADPNQLSQVLVNLLVNARDAINDRNEKEVPREIKIETAFDYLEKDQLSKNDEATLGPQVKISLSDTGIGIKDENIDKIFEPFFTTKGLGRGTGLGLSTVYGIVKQNKAHITAESKQNRGTTFNIFWPVYDKTFGRKMSADAGKSLHGGHEMILLVEDDPGVRQFALNALENLGYEIIGVSSAEKALEFIRSSKPSIDLLFTDVVLPGLNGRELVNEVHRIYPNLPVIYASGYTDDVVFQQSMRQENFTFIQKPYSVSDLTQLIRKALQKGKMG